MAETINHPCCFPNCYADAEFQLDWGSGPDTNTLACSDHVGHMCDPEKHTNVTGYDQPTALK